ncbi:hypothetical protein ACS0TY_000548 [Phlomoides rotata]
MERENASISINTYLPQEIIEGILSRLPVKSLLKFKCVSKLWCSLIGSEHFIKIHLQNSTKNSSFSHHRMIFNLVQRSQKLLMHCSLRSLLSERSVDSFAFNGVTNIQWRSIMLVGCCNGLVYFLEDWRYFFLWNPSTRTCKILPDPVDRLYDKTVAIYGFEYDESNHDYKVLIISFCSVNTIMKIYSLKTNSWKTLDCDEPSHPFGGAGKFVSGNLHWCTDVGRDCEIVSFYLKREVFEIIEQPSNLKASYFQSLGVIEGCLSVFYVYEHSHSGIWVMKEYGEKESWVKVVTLPRVHHFVEFYRGPDGEVVLFQKSCFLIYYPNNNVYQYFPRRDMGSVVEAKLYIESLVS